MRNHFALAAFAVLCCGLAFGGTPPFAEYATRAIDASRITHRNFIGGINNRLTVVQEVPYENPEDPDGAWNTALYEPVDRLWVGGISSRAEERGIGGYEYSAKGFNTGYDWSQGDLTVGVAMNYTVGDIQSNEIDTKNKVESVNLGVYASHDPLAGLFYDANATYGMSWNRSLSWEVAEGAGSREGRFRATSYGLGGNIGHSFDLALAKVTPTIGFQWTRYSQEGYTEMAGPVTPNWFAEATNSVLEIPLAVRVGTSWQLAGGTILSPEVRAAYILSAGDRQSSVTMGAVGTSGTEMNGVETGKSRMRIAAGLKANFNPTIDAFVDYSLEFRGGYTSTNLNGGLGVSF